MYTIVCIENCRTQTKNTLEIKQPILKIIQMHKLKNIFFYYRQNNNLKMYKYVCVLVHMCVCVENLYYSEFCLCPFNFFIVVVVYVTFKYKYSSKSNGNFRFKFILSTIFKETLFFLGISILQKHSNVYSIFWCKGNQIKKLSSLFI